MNDLHFFYPAVSNKAVLLIHGLTGAPAEMKYLGKYLHKKGFTVYAPLLAGHGGTVHDLLETKWEDWLQSVEEAYHQLRKTHTHVYVAGICVGGALGLELASKYPDIAGAALYSMTLRYDGWNVSKWTKLTPILSLIAGLPFIRQIRFHENHPFGLKDDRIRRLIQSGGTITQGALDYFPMGALYQMYRLSNEVQRLLPKIKTPTLLVHAREDDMSHLRNALKIQKGLGGPCDLVILEDSYHMIHVDQERRKVAELTADFFGPPEKTQERADIIPLSASSV